MDCRTNYIRNVLLRVQLQGGWGTGWETFLIILYNTPREFASPPENANAQVRLMPLSR